MVVEMSDEKIVDKPFFDNDWFDEESKENTPRRIEGYKEELEERRDFKFTTFEIDEDYDEMVSIVNIDFMSFCSHHMLPFRGTAHVAYIPNGKLCGASKIPRTVDKFAARPQIQEVMTMEIADYIEERLEPRGIMVMIEAEHMCMTERGVNKDNTSMITSSIRGVFRNPPEGMNPREEFLSMIDRR